MSIVLKPYRQAAALIEATLQKTLAEKPALLLLSGGSAVDLYGQMAASLNLEFSPGRLTVGLVDERWSQDPKHADSNDAAVRGSGLIDKLESLGSEYFPVLTGGTLQDDAAAFDKKLQELSQKHAVVAILGIGIDGHTAGMLPDPDVAAFKSRFDDKALAAGYDTGDKFESRITVTMPLLRQCKHAFLVAPSPDKAPIIKRLLNPEEEPLNTFPAKIMFEMNDVTVLGTLSEEDLI